MNRRHAFALILYAILALVMSFPLVFSPTGAIPGIAGDVSSFVWALGWAKSAVADLQVNPFHTDYVYYPLGGATQLLWAISLIGFLSIPLQALVGLVATYNLLYVAATVLTAYGTFLLAQEVLADSRPVKIPPPRATSALSPFATLLITQYVVQGRIMARRQPWLAPFTAGLVFAFAPIRLGYGLGFFNLFNTEFIPLYLVFLLRTARNPSFRPAILAGLLLGLNAYVDFQILAFLVLLTALYGAYRIVELAASNDIAQARGKASRSIAGVISALARAVRSVTLTLVPVAAACLLVVLPMLFFILQDFSAEGGNYIGVYKLDYSAERSYDLLSYFLPNARSALYSNVPLKIAAVNASAQPGDESMLSPDGQAFVGYVVLALAVYAAIRRWRKARFWVLIALVFMLFSLGPWLHVAGQVTGIPLPFIALHEIPLVNNIRIPMRYGVVVSLAAALLTALGIRQLVNTRLRLLAVLAPIVMLVEYAVLPYPLQALSIPSVYDQIGRAEGDFTVLEIPSFNWRWASATEVFQAGHEKRILRAYTNRIAPGPAEYLGLRGTPIVVRSLRVLEGVERGELTPGDIAEDRRVRDAVLGFFDLRYVVLHRDMLQPDQISRIDSYLHEVLGARVWADDGITVGYELSSPALPDTLLIDLRENVGQMYAGRGWEFKYPPENWNGEFDYVWARGSRSEIYFVARDANDLAVSLYASADTPRRIGLLLNGERVGEFEMSQAWQAHQFTLPGRAVRAGMNLLQLDYGLDLQESIAVTTIQIQRGHYGQQTSR